VKGAVSQGWEAHHELVGKSPLQRSEQPDVAVREDPQEQLAVEGIVDQGEEEMLEAASIDRVEQTEAHSALSVVGTLLDELLRYQIPGHR
jgi:hypothetical protein